MSAYPEFDIPDDYIVPEGVAEGETFEDIAEFKLKPNGQVCIVKIGSSPLLEDKGKKEPDDYGTAAGMESRISEAYKNRG